MSKKRKNLLAALCCAAICCLGVGLLSVNSSVYAAETLVTSEDMYIKEGASIRLTQLDDLRGIRWTTVVKESYYNSLKEQNPEFGVVVAPTSYIGTDGLTVEVNGSKTLKCNVTPYFVNGEFTYHYSIIYNGLDVSIKNKAYTVELTARAYVKVGDDYTYVEEYNTGRSMRAIAYESVRRGNYTKDEVGEYYDAANLTTESNNVQSGYFVGSTKSATLINVHAWTDVSKYSAYVGANKVSIEINADKKIVINGYVGKLKAGQDYYLTVFDNAGKVYLQKFTYVTDDAAIDGDPVRNDVY